MDRQTYRERETYRERKTAAIKASGNWLHWWKSRNWRRRRRRISGWEWKRKWGASMLSRRLTPFIEPTELFIWRPNKSQRG